MMASDPLTALTEFIHSLESRVFADKQSAPRQELKKEYGLPKEGRPDI